MKKKIDWEEYDRLHPDKDFALLEKEIEKERSEKKDLKEVCQRAQAYAKLNGIETENLKAKKR